MAATSSALQAWISVSTPNLPMPFGLKVNVNTERRRVRIDESYVNLL